MKITPAHYKRLETAIKEVMPLIQNVKMSNMAYRWSLWNKVCDNDHYKFANELYEYLNDNHIDSALKKITNTN